MQEHIYETVPLWKSHTLPQLYHLQNRNCFLCLLHDQEGLEQCRVHAKLQGKERFIQRGYTEILQKLLLEIFLISAQSDQFALLVSSRVQGFTPTAPAQDLPWGPLKEWGYAFSFRSRKIPGIFVFQFIFPIPWWYLWWVYSSHTTQTGDTQDTSVSKV